MPDDIAALSFLPRPARRAPLPPVEASLLAALACPAYLIDVQDYSLQPLDASARSGERAQGVPCYAHAHGRDQPCSLDGTRCPMEEAVRTRKPVQVQHVHRIPGRGPRPKGEARASPEPRLQNELVLPLLNGRGEVTRVLQCRWDVSADEARAWAAARGGATGAGHPPATDGVPALTGREREVLAGVAQGWTNAAIARQLCISVSTVKHHVGSLFGKLGAAGRAEIVVLAMRHGLLRPD